MVLLQTKYLPPNKAITRIKRYIKFFSISKMYGNFGNFNCIENVFQFLLLQGVNNRTNPYRYKNRNAYSSVALFRKGCLAMSHTLLCSN